MALKQQGLVKMKGLICKDTSTTEKIPDNLHLEVPESEADFTPEWCERVLKMV